MGRYWGREKVLYNHYKAFQNSEATIFNITLICFLLSDQYKFCSSSVVYLHQKLSVLLSQVALSWKGVALSYIAACSCTALKIFY